MVRGAAGWLLVAVLVAPAALGAQSIVGTITEGESDRPVVGAMVRLFTERGPAGPLFLTAADGRFRLRAPRPGSFWLRVERIGFAESRQGPVTVDDGETVTFDMGVVTEPVLLEGLDVEAARRRCSLGGAEGGEAQVVWDEARKALAAATWTEREAGLSFDVEHRIRSLGPRGLAVNDEARQARRTVGGNSVRTLPPDDLARGGYVREADDLVYYYGPDAEVLLSDAFLDTHCFRVVPGPDDEPHSVGLAFEPVPDRDTTDIEGVLLLDRSTARLERVEFAYTGLRQEVGRRHARGMVRFLELADGRWVVGEWYIRAPVLVLERQVGAGGELRERLVVQSVQEYGSQVMSVLGPGGVVWRSDQPLGRLQGTVFDSIQGRPLAGAGIHLAGRGWRATTDEDGRWSLPRIPPGRYRVSFGHASLDSMGVVSGWKEVTVEAGGVTQVALGVPSLPRLLALACPEPEEGVVVGLVQDGSGRSLSGVEVRVVGGLPEGAEAAVLTDGEGGFQLCGLPVETEVTVEARLGPVPSHRGTVRTEAGAAVRVNLRLGAETRIVSAPEERPGGARPAVRGRVVDAGSREPLEGVPVRIVDEEGRVAGEGLSDGTGRFRIFPGPPGAYRVRVDYFGYGTVEGHPLDLGSETREVEIRLQPEAVAVEGVVVEVRGRSRTLEATGFYDRQSDGLGLLLDREQLQAMNLQETGDIVNRVSNLANLPLGARGSMDATRRFLRFRRAVRGAGGCLPAIFVDGSMIRRGGEWNRAMPSLDEIIPVDEVEALELYEGPSTTPARFNVMGSACGVIAIWSRATGGS